MRKLKMINTFNELKKTIVGNDLRKGESEDEMETEKDNNNMI